jgi:diaminohydroxyphosphoribosylaminopyrimidine deaminase/5-amino-6-(5-phosphoribosylamino)uracil reductase
MKTDPHHIYMQRCLQLASQSRAFVGTNPMVGSVIVHEGKIIGEGYHREFGKEHAEVMAINNVKDKSLLVDSTLYVNLEPCAHHGKTPPCANLIIEHKIPKVYIATQDPFSLVAGKGIKKLKKHCKEVHVGLMEKEAIDLNRAFFRREEKNRPFIILKWAESLDSFIDIERSEDHIGSFQISNLQSKYYNHYWRSQEKAILIGKQTALVDNPKLTVRKVKGNNPIRMVIDKNLAIPPHNHLLDQNIVTWVFNSHQTKMDGIIHYVKLDFKKEVLPQLLDYCHLNGIRSIIIEGGKYTINRFLQAKLWDEIRVFKSDILLKTGLEAPNITGMEPTDIKSIGSNKIYIFHPERQNPN